MNTSGGIYDKVYFAAGNYSYTSVSVISSNHEVISTGGLSYLSKGYLGSSLAWTNLGGGVFRAPMTGVVVNCFDTSVLDSNDDPLRLTNVASSALVTSTVNSWYRDSGANLIYVRLESGLTPSASCHLSTGDLTVSSDRVNYLENMVLMGGLTLNTNATVLNSVFLMNGCKVLHRYTDNAFKVTGNWITWFKNTTAALTNADAFNYHGSGSFSGYAIEENCIGRNAGIGASNSINNGSTCHESYTILRFNGLYKDTEGSVVADVNNSKSLNISCVVGESTAVDAASKAAFAVAAMDAVSETTTMWLDGCTGGSLTTMGAKNRSLLNAKMYARKCNISNVDVGTELIPY